MALLQSLADHHQYPLTSSQRLVLLADQFTVHKQLVNIPTSCLLDIDLDLSLLKDSAAEAVSRSSVFGLRLTRRGREILQYFTDREVLCIEEADFSQRTADEMDAFFNKIARTRIAMFDKPLCKIYTVRAPDGQCGLFICASHVIMDFWAISMFYKDIFSIYFARKEQDAMPKDLPDYETLLAKEVAYRDSDKCKKDAAFWEQEISGSKPVFTHINGPVMLKRYRLLRLDPKHRYGRSFFLRTTARHYTCMISKDDVDQMKAFCQENQVPSLQALFFMGVRTAIASLNNRETDVSLFAVSARRATLEEKLAGGSRAVALPFRTIMDESTTFTEALNIILDKQNVLYRHADFDTMDIFSIMKKNYGVQLYETYFPLHFTFQPIPMVVREGVNASTRWYCNGAAATGLSLTIMDGDGKGALRCYYEYHDKLIRPETLTRFHELIMSAILAGCANPQIRLKELLDSI